MTNHVRTVLVDFDGDLVLAGDVRDDVANVAADRRWRDAMFAIVRFLLLATAGGLVHRPLHAAGDAVGIEDHSALDIARGAADGLDQRSFGAQKALLVGIEDRD